jgi:hypothetical protein
MTEEIWVLEEGGRTGVRRRGFGGGKGRGRGGKFVLFQFFSWRGDLAPIISVIYSPCFLTWNSARHVIL